MEKIIPSWIGTLPNESLESVTFLTLEDHILPKQMLLERFQITAKKPQREAGLPGRFILLTVILLLNVSFPESATSAEKIRSPPVGAPKGAPPEYVLFDTSELTDGFLRLAFGSDLQRLGDGEDRIHKFDHRIRFRISNSGHIDRSELVSTRIG